MKRLKTVLLALIVPPAGLAAQVPAPQAAMRGVVRADSTGRPLQGVEVIVEGTSFRTTTNAAGRFLLGGLPAGRWFVLFRSVGFKPVRQTVTLVAQDTVWTDALLIPGNAQELDSLVVAGKDPNPGSGLEGFEERRKLGLGRFIDSADLRRAEHLQLSDVLRRVQGIVVWEVSKIPPRYIASASRLQRQGKEDGKQKPCPLQVLLDGMPLNSVQSQDFDPARPPPTLDEFQVHNLVAVEVYRSAGEVPIEFGGAGSACGVLALWTKRR